MKKLENNDLFLTTTDTIIGLGGKVNQIVENKIYEIKKRDKNKKLVIVIGKIEQLEKMEKLQKYHYEYIKKYWPGATTLIINNQAYRMPNNKKLQDFIANEGPFYLTSANISNEPAIIDIAEARKQFPHLKVYNFGNGSNEPSIIIDTKNGKRLR